MKIGSKMDSIGNHLQFIPIKICTKNPTSCITGKLDSVVLLVSTYVVRERLSVMQRQARLPEFFDQIGKSTLFWDSAQKK